METFRSLITIATIAICIAILCAVRPAAAQTTRDPWLWPFAADSIWNTPIGDGAVYAPANINNGWDTSIDAEWFVKTTQADPYRTVYYPGPFDNRDIGTQVSWLGSMRVPDSLIIPDAINSGGVYSTPNDCSTFLQPDGRTFYQLEPTTRTSQGGPIWGYPQTDWGQYPSEGNLYGQGIRGTHYGSGMSSIGGSLRLGELVSSAPIRHALKIELWGKYYYWYSSDLPGWKWPATNADGYASSTYGGTDRNLVNGALLAIPWGKSEADIGGLESEAGRKLFRAFKEYGAYIVDDTGWYNNAICAEVGVNEELQSRYGYTLTGPQSGANSNPLSRDMGKIFRALNVVTNNGPTAKGGPGSRRVTTPIPALSVTSGTYKVTARHSGKVLDVSGVSYNSGAVVHQWTYGGGNNQKWRVDNLGNGEYRFLAVHSGKALDVRSSGTTNGTPVQQWDWNGTNAQRFRIEPVGDGYYRVINVNSGKALDVNGGPSATGNGVQVQIWDYVGGTNQQWSFDEP
jgi:hypothetical protein